MIHTTSASGCHFAKKLKGASFSRNVNTQFNVTRVLAEFVYTAISQKQSSNTAKLQSAESKLDATYNHFSVC